MKQPFLWGAATASHQVEGNNTLNDWHSWEKAGHIEGGAVSGMAADHWNRFSEDLDHASSLGLNSYRFSIEWSRIEPAEGCWDDSALAWYENLVSECEKRRLTPMVTLLHFTLPQWLAEKGGLSSPRFPGYFVRFTERVLERFGRRVQLWCTINEPMVHLLGAYIGRFMPPAEYSPRKASQACAHLLKAHVLAYDLIHQRLGTKVQVGIAQNMLHFMPDRSWHPMEQFLTRIFDRFYNLSFLHAITGGRQRFSVPFLIPRADPVQEARNRITADFIGVNYYTKAYIQWRPRAPATERPPEVPIGIAFARRMERVSDLGWAIHPQGFRHVLRKAARFGLPLYVTENGIADRDDVLRSEYLDAHLRVLSELLQEGRDIRGYFHWTLMDNFEWIKGFGPRFGLLEVDYGNQSRTMRRSAQIYARWIQRLSGSQDAGIPKEQSQQG